MFIFIIYTLTVSSEIDIAINMYSSYTAFGDLEIFLHGLGLEQMTDLLKFGITNKDQQVILAAVKEPEVEEINFGELPEVAKLEISCKMNGKMIQLVYH